MADDRKHLHITVSDGFRKTVLSGLEIMRDATWSDITLKVGNKSVYAHRIVLAVHCGYFRTLFQSNFNDSKAKEIDLSSVIEDTDVLNRIIKYMYSGTLEYSEDEFLEIARLASYFEIDLLMEQCEDKMEEQVTLSNSIEYHFFAHSHGYQDINDMTSDVIKSRFHDYFAFQESTLDLRPEDLKHMVHMGLLRYCRNAAFVEFLGNWVAKGGTDHYVEVALDVIEFLADINYRLSVPCDRKAYISLNDCCRRLKSKLNESDSEIGKYLGTLFLMVFRKLVCQVSFEKQVPLDDEEPVLFTIVERKKKQLLLEPKVERKFARSNKSDKNAWDSVYEIVLFRPQNDCWYHVHTIYSRPRPYQYSDTPLPFQQEDCQCFVIGKILICVARNSNHAMKFDLEKKEWSELTVKLQNAEPDLYYDLFWEYPKLRNHNWNDIGNHFALSGAELFVVFVEPFSMDTIGEYESYEIHGCSFQISKVDILDGSLTHIARTPVQHFNHEQDLSDLERSVGIRSSARVQINKATSEMLVLAYIDDSDIADKFEQYYSFVVNINNGSVYFFPKETTDQLKYPFKDLYIVENQDCFIIVRHFHDEYYEIVAEYKFLSKEIVFRDGILKANPDSRLNFWYFDEDPPRIDRLHYGGGSGLLSFNGYWNYTCDFKYIYPEEVDRKANVGCEENAIGSVDGEENAEVEKHSGDQVGGKKYTVENGLAEEDDIEIAAVEGNSDRESCSERNATDDRAVNGTVAEERCIEEDLNDSLNSDFEERESDKERKSVNKFERVPPPFADVKCVWEAKMDKEFMSKVTPIYEFLL